MTRNKGTNMNYKNKYSLPKGISPKTYLKEKIYDNIISSKKKKIKMTSDEFSIPEMNEYNLLLKYNYTCHQLSQICKYYKQKVSGNKNEKIFRLYNYLKYSNYARKIQKGLRGYMVRKLFEIKKLASLKSCINDTDFLTLEEIKDIELKQLIVIKQVTRIENGGNNKCYYYAFNILSLWNLIENARMEKKKKIENPYTREELDYKKIQKAGRRIFRLTKAIYGEKINIEFKDENEEVDNLMDKYKKEAVNLFQQMDALGSFITDSNWLLNLDKYYLIRFLRELRDCWDYRLQLTNETKRNICPPNGRPFDSINITSLGHRQYPYVLRKSLKMINKLINTGVDDKSKNLGIFYVLGALTIQSQEAANALPWMYESFAVQNN